MPAIDAGPRPTYGFGVSDLVLGIDLGTTNSAVGVVDSGFPVLLADSEGRRITPSAVWIGRNGEIEVGTKALRRRAAEPDRDRPAG